MEKQQQLKHMIKAPKDKILVHHINQIEKTDSGILIDSTKVKSQTKLFKVISISSNNPLSKHIAVDDTVIVSAGSMFEYDFKTYHLINNNDILAVMPPQ